MSNPVHVVATPLNTCRASRACRACCDERVAPCCKQHVTASVCAKMHGLDGVSCRVVRWRDATSGIWASSNKDQPLQLQRTFPTPLEAVRPGQLSPRPSERVVVPDHHGLVSVCQSDQSPDEAPAPCATVSLRSRLPPAKDAPDTTITRSRLVWRSCNGVRHINEITLRRSRLVLGLVTTVDGSTISRSLSRPLRPTQPGHPFVGKCNEYRRWFRPSLERNALAPLKLRPYGDL